MSTFSKKLGGIILSVDHFGSHLDTMRNITNSNIELRNFNYASKKLCDLWQKDDIHRHKVAINYIDYKINPFDETFDISWNWIDKYCQICHYSLDIRRCDNIRYCSSWKNEAVEALLAKNNRFLLLFTKDQDGHFLSCIHILQKPKINAITDDSFSLLLYVYVENVLDLIHLKVLLLELPFLKMESEDNIEFLEEQTLNVKANNQNLGELVDAPMIGQTFGSWDELDHFISFYAKSQNFVSMIRGSEYKDGSATNSKQTYRMPLANSCKLPKTTGVLSITSLHLSHNDYPVKDETNKTQYRMLTKQYPDTFFLPKDLTNTIQTFKRQNHVEYEAAILLNHLLEHKSDDNRWVINWKDKLLLKFPDAAPYLNRALSNEKEKWALCYTSKIFTAGMQSTQRVESQNSIIKNSVN
ncbi:10036_t:CDS:2, partial [Gigaspora margarita]